VVQEEVEGGEEDRDKVGRVDRLGRVLRYRSGRYSS